MVHLAFEGLGFCSPCFIAFGFCFWTSGGWKEIHQALQPRWNKISLSTSVTATAQHQSGKDPIYDSKFLVLRGFWNYHRLSCFISYEKTIRLFYHHQVEVENPDLVTFPDFSKASYQECVLRPRDVLFIPQQHWHYVRSLELSFSVSFWWSWFLQNKTACVVKSCIAFICTNATFFSFRHLYAYINVLLTVNDGVIIQYCHELDVHFWYLWFC